VTARLPETYQWLLVPGQASPTGAVEWQSLRLTGTEALAQRAAKKLKNEELLVVSLAASRLRLEIDRVPLWRKAANGSQDHVAIKQLAEDFAKYLYLPRLQTTAVLTEAIHEGVKLLTWQQDAFAYAEDYDEAAGRYRGLKTCQMVHLSGDAPMGVIVRPERACAQQDKEKPTTEEEPKVEKKKGGLDGPGVEEPPPRQQLSRFHGTVRLDSARTGRDASRVADEVVAHLTGLMGSKVTVTLEIGARVPEGIPERVVRIVTENCQTLKFDDHGFEME
jgi:hypothetical protein